MIQGIMNLFQREDAVNDGPNAMVLDECKQIPELCERAAGGAEDLKLTHEQALQIRARLSSGRGPTGDQPSTPNQRFHGLGPDRFADVFNHHIHAAPVRVFQSRFRHLLFLTVDGGIGPHGQSAVEFVCVPRGYNHSGTCRFGQLHRGQRDPTAHAKHQNGFPGFHLGLGEQHPPGGQEVNAQSCALGVREMTGQRKYVLGWHADPFCKSAIGLLSQELNFETKALITPLAEFAPAATEGRKQNHGLAFVKIAAVFVGFRDNPGTVHAHDLWQLMGNASATVAHVQVDLVKRGGLDLNQNVTGLTLRFFTVPDFDHFVAIVAGNKRGFHHRFSCVAPVLLDYRKLRFTRVSIAPTIPLRKASTVNTKMPPRIGSTQSRSGPWDSWYSIFTTKVAPTTGPSSVPMPPTRVIRMTSPDICQWASLRDANWNTTDFMEPARPASAAEITKARTL